VRVALQRKIRQIVESEAAALAVDLAGCGVASDYLCGFDIEQMRLKDLLDAVL
jgi:hypothetical protein